MSMPIPGTDGTFQMTNGHFVVGQLKKHLRNNIWQVDTGQHLVEVIIDKNGDPTDTDENQKKSA